MTGKKRSKYSPKRRGNKDTKGILLSNPIVAAQVGAAAGSLLAAMYVEKPKAFDGIVPLAEKYGRIHEREDVVAYLELCMTGKRTCKLSELARSLRAGIHEGEGKDRVQAALSRELDFLKETWKVDFAEGIKEGQGPLFHCANKRCSGYGVQTPGNRASTCPFCKKTYKKGPLRKKPGKR